MKKFVISILCVIGILGFSITIRALDYSLIVYYPEQLKYERINIQITGLEVEDSDDGYILVETEDWREWGDVITPVLNEQENFIVLNLKTKCQENPYPDVQGANIRIYADQQIGRERETLLGTDYRVYLLKDGELEAIEIESFNATEVNFNIEKLSTYIFCYNPKVYSVAFYEDKIERDINNEIINAKYFSINELRKYDTFEFPEVPRREGYIFTGWKQIKQTGAYLSDRFIFPVETSDGEWEIYAYDVKEIYASWCPEDEYTPLEVLIESDSKITKGKEDGCEITLTLSEGKFDETIDEDIENDWKIVGSDGLSIASVERIDDRTAKLTLSGNSSHKYKKEEIQIEFNSGLYISCEYDDYYMTAYEIADIQLDEKGVKKAMFISDNAITLNEVKSELSIVELSENCLEVETLEQSGVVILVIYNSDEIVKEVITKKAEKRVVFDNVDLTNSKISLMQWNGIDMLVPIAEKITTEVSD